MNEAPVKLKIRSSKEKECFSLILFSYCTKWSYLKIKLRIFRGYATCKIQWNITDIMENKIQTSTTD
jgi:hypothetical protein